MTAKIISDASAGEKPRRRRRISLRVRLRAYAWDKTIAKQAIWALLRGSIEIGRYAYSWCLAAKDPGDRFWRAAGILAGPPAAAYWGLPRLPDAARSTMPGLLIVGWAGAALVLGHRAIAAAAKAKPKKTPAAAASAPEPTPAERAHAVRIALLQLLEIHTRGRNGIHLGELHEILTKTTAYKALRKKDVGPLLEAHHIPYLRSLSVGGIAGRSGVRRDTVLALLTAISPDPAQANSQTKNTGSDLHESQPVSTDSQPAHTSI